MDIFAEWQNGRTELRWRSTTAANDGPELTVFSRRSLEHGGEAWTTVDVGEAAGLVLYRAVADGYWMLAKDGAPDHRIPVDPA